MRRCPSEPAQVDIILDGAVRVRRLLPLASESLRDLGYRLRTTRYGTEIEFEPSSDGSGGDLSNQSLIRLLQVLSALGVAFARDYKQGWSPADVVTQLLEEGTDFENPQGVGFDGSSWWTTDLPT